MHNGIESGAEKALSAAKSVKKVGHFKGKTPGDNQSLFTTLLLHLKHLKLW